jgi:hypothetical protein
LSICLIIYVLSINPTKIAAAEIDTPVTKKVLILDFNPILENKNSQRLRQYKVWNDPPSLETQYINSVKTLSHGYVNYQIVERISNIDEIPVKADGFQYTDDTYLAVIDNGSPNHSPDYANYNTIISKYQLCEKLNAGTIDEVWMWGGPWFGSYESTMTGHNSFHVNSPPVLNTTCTRQMVIMGFSYQRGLAEMLEDLGHRTESTLTYFFGSSSDSPWYKYTIYDKNSPGNSQCGSVHYAPNSFNDYDWANTTVVSNACDDWFNYPNLTGNRTNVNCSIWGCTAESYQKWWLNHIPVFTGTSIYNGNYKWNNWWKYVVVMDQPVQQNCNIATLWNDARNSPGNYYIGDNWLLNGPATPNQILVIWTTTSPANALFTVTLPSGLDYFDGESYCTYNATNRQVSCSYGVFRVKVTITTPGTLLKNSTAVGNGACMDIIQVNKPGDSNNDNAVDGRDYVVWLNHYGQTINGIPNGNFNNDANIDGRDYVVWLNNYGK